MPRTTESLTGRLLALMGKHTTLPRHLRLYFERRSEPQELGGTGLGDERRAVKTRLGESFTAPLLFLVASSGTSYDRRLEGGWYGEYICPRLPPLPQHVDPRADVTHCPHCERSSVCFLWESSPSGLQGFPGRQVGYPLICECVCVCVHALGVFFIHAGLRKRVVWPGISSAPSETPLWEQCLATGTSLSHTRALRFSYHFTFKRTRKYTNGHEHTRKFTSRPPSKHTYTHASRPQTMYRIAAPQIWCESPPEDTENPIWAGGGGGGASMVEGVNVARRKRRFPP